ncbi:DUF5693 family protein [Paenibacillus sp. MMO-177]|uniref:DUF5693 family protein n=1 Tax=Paenibacillus sp. MMO-177 TaxID=3081289 RepID=UPI00301B14AA
MVKTLWILVILGAIAAIPAEYSRWKMEKSAKQVEYIFDFRDLQEMATNYSNPNQYILDRLSEMKKAGITTISINESTLNDFVLSGRIDLYNETDLSMMQNTLSRFDENYTYVLFRSEEATKVLTPIIKQRFMQDNIVVLPWSYKGRSGLIVETSLKNAMLKTMEPDPLTLNLLQQKGYQIIPRLTNRVPYNQKDFNQLLINFKQYHIRRILFEGNQVTGYTEDSVGKQPLYSFGELLKKYDMGLITIENLQQPPKGFQELAKMIGYNVTRLYSLSEIDAERMSPNAIKDRFLLAAKDRNIRMFFINGMVVRQPEKNKLSDSLDYTIQAMRGSEGIVNELKLQGFSPGEAEALEPLGTITKGWEKPFIALGAIGMITLLFGAFSSSLLFPIFILGLLGIVVFQMFSPTLGWQILALGAAVSAPTVGVIWAVERISRFQQNSLIKQRSQLLLAITFFIFTTCITLIGGQFIVGSLDDISYNLRLQQFRGVSLLHLLPIILVGLYVCVFMGHSIKQNALRILQAKITVIWIVSIAFLLGVGYYYISRTGNGGSVLSIELIARNWLEQTLGVRPRTKEFLFAHPIAILGFYLLFRYRAARLIVVVGVIGQLSMLDTLAHLHTPLQISIVRNILGLGLGLLFGLLLIGIWWIGELIFIRLNLKSRFLSSP